MWIDRFRSAFDFTYSSFLIYVFSPSFRSNFLRFLYIQWSLAQNENEETFDLWNWKLLWWETHPLCCGEAIVDSLVFTVSTADWIFWPRLLNSVRYQRIDSVSSFFPSRMQSAFSYWIPSLLMAPVTVINLPGRLRSYRSFSLNSAVRLFGSIISHVATPNQREMFNTLPPLHRIQLQSFSSNSSNFITTEWNPNHQ